MKPLFLFEPLIHNFIILHFFHFLKTILNEKKLLFQLVPFKIYTIMKTVSCFIWLPWASTRSSHWDVFLEINLNQKILKLYSIWVHWKNQCRLTIRKHALLWNKHEYQHSADDLLKISLTHFLALESFYTLLNTSENQSFPDLVRRHREKPVPWNRLKVI